MKSIAFFALMVFLLICVAESTAAEQTAETFDRFAGLQAHIGRQPDITIERIDLDGFRKKEFRVDLTVDDRGRVIEFSYPNDTIPDLKCYKKAYDKLEFSQLPGMIAMPIPVIIPVRVKTVWDTSKKGRLLFDFPIRHSHGDAVLSDTTLLKEYFSLNGIEPPGIRRLPVLSYFFPGQEKDGRYLTVAAYVSIDETGEVTDISFPIENMSRGKHQVFMALLRGDFRPLKIGNGTEKCSFWAVFRLFDNIEYPFQPVVGGEFDSTATHAEKWFVKTYFNADDLPLCPLPREFPDLRMPVSGLTARLTIRTGVIEVSIDTLGIVSSARARNNSGAAQQPLKNIARRLTFYPAVDSTGRPVPFTGKIRIFVDENKNVVYIPEWLE